MTLKDLLELSASHEIRYRLILSTKRFQAFRVARGMTQKDLADKLGVTVAFVSDMERGKKYVPPWVQDGLIQIFSRG